MYTPESTVWVAFLRCHVSGLAVYVSVESQLIQLCPFCMFVDKLSPLQSSWCPFPSRSPSLSFSPSPSLPSLSTSHSLHSPSTPPYFLPLPSLLSLSLSTPPSLLSTPRSLYSSSIPPFFLPPPPPLPLHKLLHFPMIKPLPPPSAVMPSLPSAGSGHFGALGVNWGLAPNTGLASFPPSVPHQHPRHAPNPSPAPSSSSSSSQPRPPQDPNPAPLTGNSLITVQQQQQQSSSSSHALPPAPSLNSQTEAHVDDGDELGIWNVMCFIMPSTSLENSVSFTT